MSSKLRTFECCAQLCAQTEEEPELQRRRCEGESGRPEAGGMGAGMQAGLAWSRFKLTESTFELQAEPVTSPTPRLNTPNASVCPRHALNLGYRKREMLTQTHPLWESV